MTRTLAVVLSLLAALTLVACEYDRGPLCPCGWVEATTATQEKLLSSSELIKVIIYVYCYLLLNFLGTSQEFSFYLRCLVQSKKVSGKIWHKYIIVLKQSAMRSREQQCQLTRRTWKRRSPKVSLSSLVPCPTCELAAPWPHSSAVAPFRACQQGLCVWLGRLELLQETQPAFLEVTVWTQWWDFFLCVLDLLLGSPHPFRDETGGRGEIHCWFWDRQLGQRENHKGGPKSRSTLRELFGP